MRKQITPKVPGWESVPSTCGVYALWSGEECQYVGSSINLNKRVRLHPRRAGCTHVTWTMTPEADLVGLEQAWIEELRPTLNTAHHAWRTNFYGLEPAIRKLQKKWRCRPCQRHDLPQLSAAQTLWADYAHFYISPKKVA